MRLQLLPVFYFFLWRRGPVMAEDTTNQNSPQEAHLETIIKRVLPKTYNSQMAPENLAEISISFVFLTVSQVDFSKMELEVEFFFNASWIDSRLNTEGLEDVKDMKRLLLFEVPESATKKIWKPKLTFPSCKHCGLGMVTGLPFVLSFAWKYKMFTILLSYTMTFSCQYDLSYYPFETHVCYIYIQNLDHLSGTDIKLKNASSQGISPDAFIVSGMPPEFQFKRLNVEHKCSQKNIAFHTTSDRCLRYSITFKRIASYHIMLVYCPTVIIILISWISFWLPVDSTAPRISLGMTSLLTMTTQFTNVQKNFPPVAYIKGLDIWMIMCIFMVFGSLLEFTLAHIFRYPKDGVQPLKPETEKEETKFIKPIPTPGGNNQKLSNIHVEIKKHHRRRMRPTEKEVNWLDAKARIVFPLFFFVFNAVYWPCFTSGGG